jgi:hypothetical protein
MMARGHVPKWSGLRDPNSDLCWRSPHGYYDVVQGVAEWTACAPVKFEGAQPNEVGTFRRTFATRDEAQPALEAHLRSL